MSNPLTMLLSLSCLLSCLSNSNMDSCYLSLLMRFSSLLESYPIPNGQFSYNTIQYRVKQVFKPNGSFQQCKQVLTMQYSFSSPVLYLACMPRWSFFWGFLFNGLFQLREVDFLEKDQDQHSKNERPHRNCDASTARFGVHLCIIFSYY